MEAILQFDEKDYERDILGSEEPPEKVTSQIESAPSDDGQGSSK